MSKEKLILNVSLPNENETFTNFTFDVLLHHINENVMYMTLGPVPVSRTCQKCVFIEFDPSPDKDDDLGHMATIQSYCFNAKCTRSGTRPLEPKSGSRSMLLGALYALLHLAHKEKRWLHLTTFSLNDESDYKCKLNAAGKEYNINTFATDLLTQGTTYYQRYLNAELSASRARKTCKNARKTILSPVPLSGHEFLNQLQGLVNPDHILDEEQVQWMHSNSSSLKYIFDDAKQKGNSWETAFKHVQSMFACKMYACCFEQLIIFFNLLSLKGASYEVYYKNLPGYKTKVVARNTQSIDVVLSGGSPSNIERLYNKIIAMKFKR